MKGEASKANAEYAGSDGRWRHMQRAERASKRRTTLYDYDPLEPRLLIHDSLLSLGPLGTFCARPVALAIPAIPPAPCHLRCCPIRSEQHSQLAMVYITGYSSLLL